MCIFTLYMLFGCLGTWGDLGKGGNGKECMGEWGGEGEV